MDLEHQLVDAIRQELERQADEGRRHRRAEGQPRPSALPLGQRGYRPAS